MFYYSFYIWENDIMLKAAKVEFQMKKVDNDCLKELIFLNI